jgi:hypothetical protein
MEALFNNKFATSKSLMAAEKLAAEKKVKQTFVVTIITCHLKKSKFKKS